MITYPPEMLPSPDEGQEAEVIVIGAIDLSECPWGRHCYCEPKCRLCGFGPHMAVHGPVFGCAPGTAPYDHQFSPQGPKR